MQVFSSASHQGIFNQDEDNFSINYESPYTKLVLENLILRKKSKTA
jgi:hypothetical protein